MVPRMAQPGLGAHDRRHHAPLLGVGGGRAVEERLGVGVRGQDVELADRHVVGGWSLLPCGLPLPNPS